jgi:hypothetical protein
MYDENKLNSYWEEREKIWELWSINGWDGNFQNYGRTVKYRCGAHELWAAWGISNEEVNNVECCCCPGTCEKIES